ncbi:MAG: DUF937 domain-containing protein [Parvibaculaceae bacterium]
MNLEELGRQFGLDEAQTRAAFEQLAPVVAAGVRRNTQSPQGLEGLIRALQSGDHGRYVEEPSALEYDRVADDGNAILGHVFGSKDVSRGVANQAADLSGVSSAVLKKMLPVIAAIVMGQLAKKFTGGAQAAPQQAGGGLGDILGEILAGGGAAQQQSRGGGGGLGDILGDILGGGAGASQPQSRGQGGGLGDILGDILGGGAGGGGAAPQAPRPQPGSGGGFSLDDLLREMTGGGGAGPQQQEEVVQRSRKSIDDMLGGGSQTGNAADDLLNSVERHIRRR